GRKTSRQPCSPTPGPVPPHDIIATPCLEYHGLDALTMEQVGEHEPGRSCPDDADLCLIRPWHIGPHPGPPPDGEGGTSAVCGGVRRRPRRGSAFAEVQPVRAQRGLRRAAGSFA